MKKFVLISLLIKLQVERKVIKEVVGKQENDQIILEFIGELAKEKIALFHDVMMIAEYYQIHTLDTEIEKLKVASIRDLASKIRGTCE